MNIDIVYHRVYNVYIMNAQDILNVLVSNDDECLIYPANTSSVRIDGKMTSFAKIIYEEFIGNLPYRSRILRSCDNGKCLNPSHMLPSSAEDKFWSHVEKSNDCWNWVGGKDGGGYGCFSSSMMKERKSHRISWILHYGEIPNGMHILHHCDNPSCVNPNHLFIGKNVDNVRDKIRKGRIGDFSGTRNGMCKLTENEVLNIRKLHDEGVSYRMLSKKFNIGMTQIGRIIRKESWAWL